MTENPAEPVRESKTTVPERAVVWAAVFLSMLVFSAIRAPVPAVNEPHYLCKAKHYWNPEWCAGDFFLESSNTHLVFYQSLGFFTQFLTLAETAWLGRLTAFAILAWGWVRLVGQIAPGRWTGLWAIWTFSAVAAVGNLSGEWMIGGVEAKIFAYGFGFWAIACWQDRLWYRSAFLAGLGVSFHPVVGGWIAICAAAGTIGVAIFSRRDLDVRRNDASHLTVADTSLAAGIFLLACLPGIVPALTLLNSTNAEDANLVTQIQVFDRIRHHMDPMSFSQGQYAAYGLMVVVWLLARHRLKWGKAENQFAWFTAASILVALAGIGLGYGERPIESPDEITWRYRLLKFYPFRLADILVPMAVSVTFSGLMASALSQGRLELWQSPPGRVWTRCWLFFVSLFAFSLLYPAIDRNPSRLSEEQLADWLAVCEWIKQETPEDTMVWTPRGSWAFKWYAHRAEYVSRKDCPQNAEGIIEWARRMEIQKQRQLPTAFRNHEKLNYAILRVGRGKLPVVPVYENDNFRIYDLKVFSRE